MHTYYWLKQIHYKVKGGLNLNKEFRYLIPLFPKNRLYKSGLFIKNQVNS